MLRKKWSMLVLLLAAVVSAGCGKNGDGNAAPGNASGSAANEGTAEQTAVVDSKTLKAAQEKGYITIGFANEKPYAYKEADGTLTGEAVEITKVILKRLGVDEVRGELTEFGSLIGGLQAKRFDMITAGMFINPERCQAVLFANPEYSIGGRDRRQERESAQSQEL
ncbi:transporter substrate-binding domain-containing protein [Cohnella rhizosphaerae]|uniref:transporter substrate-binding domain-containing protein n=1 Tax=Cohnella rhizosphaerae TaxID=1457232 RepID=UPI003B8A7903